MARTTQYIGLNAKAMAFIKENHLVPREPNDAPKDVMHGHKAGMFEEDVSMGSWTDHDGNAWDEVMQASPWSSGPMIFTCLEKRGTRQRAGEWIEDPELSRMGQEFSFEQGKFYV